MIVMNYNCNHSQRLQDTNKTRSIINFVVTYLHVHVQYIMHTGNIVINEAPVMCQICCQKLIMLGSYMPTSPKGNRTGDPLKPNERTFFSSGSFNNNGNAHITK